MAASAVVAAPECSRRASYGQILKSSVTVGGSSAANILIGVARAKAMALLLGPAGVGLSGLFSSVADLAFTVGGLGINSSGVREIAAAAGSGDEEKIARVTYVTRRVWMALGLIGVALLTAFSGPIARLTFGSGRYAGAICLLSAAVFFRLVSSGQSALVQGMRRISDLAKMSVWGALLGALLSVSVVYFLREDGIVPSIVLGTGATALISWRYSRKIKVRAPRLTAREVLATTRPLLQLGLAFMLMSLMTMGSAYLIRIMVLHAAGVEATGLYHAAWTIGGLYAGFVLQAMGADFYPRLTACAEDHEASNRLVNEQAQIGLLLGGPGVMATLTFAPLVMATLYSAKFAGAVDNLRWISLGTALQVVSWPMGYIILAKGRKTMFLLADVAWMAVYLSLAFFLVKRFGANGAGMAFCGVYAFNNVQTYMLASRLTGFRATAQTLKIAVPMLLGMAVVFAAAVALPFGFGLAIGAVFTAGTSVYSLRKLLQLVSPERIPKVLRPVAAWTVS